MEIGKVNNIVIYADTKDGQEVQIDLTDIGKDATLSVCPDYGSRELHMYTNSRRVELYVPNYSGIMNVKLSNDARGEFRRMMNASKM